MKAISIRQPWAWLITQGHKDIENRTWSTKYRGSILIHAAKGYDKKDWDFAEEILGVIVPSPSAILLGGIIGRAEIVDCVTRHSSMYFHGPYGFVLKNQETATEFIESKGMLGIYDFKGGRLPNFKSLKRAG